MGTVVSPAYVYPSLVPYTPIRAVEASAPFVAGVVANVVGIVTQLAGEFIFIDIQFTSSGLSSSYFSMLGTQVAKDPIEVSLIAEFGLSAEFYDALGFNVAAEGDGGAAGTVVVATDPVVRSVSAFIFVAYDAPPVTEVNTCEAVQDDVAVDV